MKEEYILELKNRAKGKGKILKINVFVDWMAKY
jgi:hypothetical protein